MVAARGSKIVRAGARRQPIWLFGVRSQVAKLIGAPAVVIATSIGAGR